MRKINKKKAVSLFITALFSANMFNFGILAKAEEGNDVEISLKPQYNADIVLTVEETAVDSTNFESDLRAKLNGLGINDSRIKVSGLKAEEISAEDTFAWEIYDHKGNWRETNYPNGDGQPNPSDNQHIIVKNDGKNIVFYGYGQPGYKDFMFMPNKSDSKKTFDFELDEDGINYHSMEGGGFLFNSSIDENGILNGYSILFTQTGVVVYKITNVDANIFHNSTNKLMSNYPGITTIKTYTKAPSKNHTIKIETTKNSISMWDNGSKTIDNLKLDSEYGNGFGPIASYISHNCTILSYFSFNNLSMQTTSYKKFKDLIQEPEWEVASKKFVVNLNDTSDSDFHVASEYAIIQSRIATENLHYIGWGTDSNKLEAEDLIAKNNGNGIYADNTDYQASIDKIANYIVNVLKQESNGETKVLIGQPIDVAVSPSEYASNTANSEYPLGGWKFVHDDTYYENSMGKATFDGQYIDNLYSTFDKPGKYDISFRDNIVTPNTVYAHRLPIAAFDVTIQNSSGTYTIAIDDKSYDIDRQSQSDKGIKESLWQWRELDSSTWNNGQIPSTLEANKQYLIQLKVKDYDDAWSNPYVKYVSTVEDAVEKPIADFTLTPDILYSPIDESVTIMDNSYDPQGNPIIEKEWKVVKDKTVIYTGGTPMTDFTGNSAGVYTISLTVKTSNGESDTFSRIFTIKDLQKEADDAKADVFIGYQDEDNATSVTKDLILPSTSTNNTLVRWTSDDVAVNKYGNVTRPNIVQGDRTVNLTATIYNNGVTSTKDFQVLVKAAPNNIPELTEGTLELEMNDSHTFKGSDFSSLYSDSEGSAEVKIRITSIPDNGKLLYDGEQVNVNQEILIFDMEKLKFEPDKDFVGDVELGYAAYDGYDYSLPSKIAISVKDSIAPQIVGVSITSNNSKDSTYAKAGDTIRLTFSVTEELSETPNVTILGNEAEVTKTSDKDYEATYVVTKEDSQGIVEFEIGKLKDKNNNESETINSTTDDSKVIVDTIAPTISNVIEGKSYKPGVKPTANEGTATIDGNDFTLGNEVVNEGNHTIIVTDKAGNTSSLTFNVDGTAPIISDVADNTYYNTAVYPKFNEGTATLNGKPFVSGNAVSEEGNYQLIVVDEAGNTSSVSFVVDKTPPVIKDVMENGKYNKAVNPTFNEGTATLDGEEYNSGDTISSEGTHKIVVTDTSENKSTVTFTIDKTAPVITGVKEDESYNKDVTISFNEGLGILDGKPFTNGAEVSEEGKHTIIVVDEAGNISSVSFEIDKTAPIITGVEEGEKYSKDVVATFNEGEGLLNGVPFTSGTEIKEEGNYTLVVTDKAGNTTVVEFTIDKSMPKTLDLKGKVKTSGGSVGGAKVTLVDANGKVIATTTTDKDGNYVFEDQKTGLYKVIVDTDGHKQETEVNLSPVKPTDKEIVQDVYVSKYKVIVTASPNSIVGDGQDTTTLTVQVFDENNKPVPEKNVTISVTNGTLKNGDTVVTDKDGSALFTLQSSKVTGDDMVTVTVSAKVDGLDVPVTNNAVVHFAPGSIKGVVVDNETGLPVAGAVVEVSKDFDNNGIPDFYAKYITGSDGKYKIAIPKGNVQYDVKITKNITIGNATKLVTFNQKTNAGNVSSEGKESYNSTNTATGLLLMKDPDGNVKTIESYSNYSMTILDENGNVVQGIAEDKDPSDDNSGIFNFSGLEKGKTYYAAVYYNLPDGTKIKVGTSKINVNNDGELNIVNCLIDPYGDITNIENGDLIVGAHVKLYYADTKRNRDKGLTPNTLVDLPTVNDFPPADNLNPQYSDENGKYAWMVFSHTDYYIVATADGYEDYTSSIITVEEEIVRYDIQMTPIKKPATEVGNNTNDSTSNTNNDELVQTGSLVDMNTLLYLGIIMALAGVVIFRRKEKEIK